MDMIFRKPKDTQTSRKLAHSHHLFLKFLMFK